MNRVTRIGGLFEGYGGLTMGVRAVLGGELAWYSEHEPPTENNPRPTQGPARLLAYRHPGVPNLGDITLVDWTTVEPVDVLTGGSPCQDVSSAGKRRGMRAGTRSGLWESMREAIAVLRPSLVVWENVRGVTSACAHSDLADCPRCVGGAGNHEPVLRALGRVLGDLADLGFDAEWHGLRAADVGAAHGRFRIFVVAWNTADCGRHALRLAARCADATAGSAGRPDSDAADPDGATGRWNEPRSVAPRQTEGAVPETGWRTGRGGGASPPDPPRDGRHERRTQPARLIGRPNAPQRGTGAAPNTEGDTGRLGCGDGRIAADTRCAHGQRGETQVTGGVGTEGSSDRPEQHRQAVADTYGDPVREQPVAEPWRSDAAVAGQPIQWGQYEPAIRRWERLTRPAPAPTEPNTKGGHRLSPAFVEWMQGLPAGHVTDPAIGLTRNEQLKLLGNGVVPQQAEAASRICLSRLWSERAA